MKSTVVERKRDGEIKYPCLRWVPSDGTVVLFTAVMRGVVLRRGNGPNPGDVGYYGDSWRMADFEPFPGTITLEND